MSVKNKKLIIIALFIAFTCVTTIIIRIPIPGTIGYAHIGDCMVILAGVFLGPVGGFLAAGIGSALADLLGGYVIYVPITFCVKGLVALTVGAIFRKCGHANKMSLVIMVICGIIDIVFVVFGYFIFDYLMYGNGAIAGILANILQGIIGLALTLILYPVLKKIPDLKNINKTE